MESKPSELITVPRSRKLARRQFLGGSDARIITSADEAPVMRRLRHEQNINVSPSLLEIRCAPVLSSPNRQRRRLRACGSSDVRTREAATDNSRLPKILQPS